MTIVEEPIPEPRPGPDRRPQSGQERGSRNRSVDPDSMAAVARHAEACGVSRSISPGHIVVYPGA
jgi:hypothetical protein